MRGSSGVREIANATGATEAPRHADRKWLSVHLPFAGEIYSAHCDELLREVVAPFIARMRRDGSIEGAFFVRYRESGSHVRLRMLPVSESARTRVRDAIERVWTSNQQGVASLSMAWVEYEAELDRYGGEVAIPATERLFDSSSCFALVAVTPEVSANRSSRLGRAILATLTALHTLIGTCGGVCAFARTYTDSYLLAQQMDEAQRRATIRSFDVHAGSDLDPMREYLEYAWEQLELGEPLSPALDNYREALVQYRRDIEALLPTGCVAVRGRTLTDWAVAGPRLGSSIVHMTNNRLGVAIPEEAYVAHLIHRVFDAAER